MLLAGDVGGTKTALALFEAGGDGFTPTCEAVLPSREFPTLEAVIAGFLAAGPRVAVEAACFGVAGPVVNGRCVTTNLPWVLDEATLAATIPARRVRLLNDLEATAYGVLALRPASLETLWEGAPRQGNLALIAAGTGLGEALMIWDGLRHHVVATEGGHADFAPRTDLEVELLRFLRKEFGRVSYERILSGPGLFNIYRFLREQGGACEPHWLRARLESEDGGTVVSEVGLAGGHSPCVQALDVLASVYGAEAGNLALKALALGGASSSAAGSGRRSARSSRTAPSSPRSVTRADSPR